MPTMTKQVKLIMNAYRYYSGAETSIKQKIEEMYDAGLTDANSDAFWRSENPEVNYYNINTRYFTDATASQQWIDFWTALNTEYNIGTILSCVIQDYTPNGTWAVNIDGPSVWNVQYSTPSSPVFNAPNTLNSSLVLTKQVKTVMNSYNYNQMAETLKNQKLAEMYAAGKSDGYCDAFRRFRFASQFYAVSTRYFTDAVAAQEWSDYWSALNTEYALGITGISIENYIPNGTWTINIDGPNEWIVNYSPPPV